MCHQPLRRRPDFVILVWQQRGSTPEHRPAKQRPLPSVEHDHEGAVGTGVVGLSALDKFQQALETPWLIHPSIARSSPVCHNPLSLPWLAPEARNQGCADTHHWQRGINAATSTATSLTRGPARKWQQRHHVQAGREGANQAVQLPKPFQERFGRAVSRT
jgi:hypothetical protein